MLKRGDRCFVTFLLLNGEFLRAIEGETSTLDLRHDFGTHCIMDLEAPDDAIGYDEALVIERYQKYGLRLQPPVRYGSFPEGPPV